MRLELELAVLRHPRTRIRPRLGANDSVGECDERTKKVLSCVYQGPSQSRWRIPGSLDSKKQRNVLTWRCGICIHKHMLLVLLAS